MSTTFREHPHARPLFPHPRAADTPPPQLLLVAPAAAPRHRGHSVDAPPREGRRRQPPAAGVRHREPPRRRPLRRPAPVRRAHAMYVLPPCVRCRRRMSADDVCLACACVRVAVVYALAEQGASRARLWGRCLTDCLAIFFFFVVHDSGRPHQRRALTARDTNASSSLSPLSSLNRTRPSVWSIWKCTLRKNNHVCTRLVVSCNLIARDRRNMSLRARGDASSSCTKPHDVERRASSV